MQSLAENTTNATMPLVDLLVEPPTPTVTASSNTHVSTGTARQPLLRPDDSLVPPEPGAISEQPELSHVKRQNAEMEMAKSVILSNPPV